MDAHSQLLALAARQHGLAHRKQITALGLSPEAVAHLVSSGRWSWRTGTVLELVGSPPTDKQYALACVLDLAEGSALSHDSSVATWGVPGFALRPVHVVGVRERGRRSAHLARVHQPRIWLPHHVYEVDGIPVVSPTLALFQIAGLHHPARVERALDNALAMGLTSPRRLHIALAQLQRRGRPGIALMRELLRVRGDDYRPPASGLEARFQRLAANIGVHELERQVDIGDDDGWIGRIDFRHRELPLLVEIDSDRFHTSLLDRASDATRDERLRRAGFVVLRFTEFQVWHRPHEVEEALLEAIWRVKAGL
jgi:very-short-patch-repair endonuclease